MASKAGKKKKMTAKKRIGEATRARMRARGDASAERVKKLVSDAVFRSAGASAAKEIAEAFDEAASLHPPATTLRDLAVDEARERVAQCPMQVGLQPCAHPAEVRVHGTWICEAHAWEYLDERRVIAAEDAATSADPLRVKLEAQPKFARDTRTVRKVHWLKCWEEQYDAVARGEKHHEVRRSDRDYRVGDHLVLRRWSAAKGAYTAPHSAIRVEVTHLTSGGQFGLPADACVMSIAHVSTAGALCCAIHPRGHERSVPRFESVR